GNDTATIFGDRRHSWMEFRDRAARLAAGLKALGVARGDRVAILALNSDRYLEYYVAVPWAGAVVVPLNTRWSEAELTYALNDSGATCLFLDDAFLKHAAALLGQVASLRRIVYLGEQSTALPRRLRRPDPWHRPARRCRMRRGRHGGHLLHRRHDRIFQRGHAVAPQPVGERDGVAGRGRTATAVRRPACGPDVPSCRRRGDRRL